MRPLEYLLAFLAPYDCLVCGTEGSLLCVLCSEDAFDPVPSRCYRCFALSRDSAVCGRCRPGSRLRYVWIGTEYDGIAKQLIRLLKYERARTAASPIAERVLEALPYIPPDTIVVHIPTATSRHRARGYDQSEVIARIVAKRLGLKHASLLERNGQTRQVGATKQRRIAQAAGMFRVDKPEQAAGSSVLLVDDILTTGSSLESAAKCLKTVGAKAVSAVVFAQKH